MAIKNFLVGILYFLVALATEWGAETLAVWPAAGIALAALMIYGNRLWPGLWMGAFAASLCHFLQYDEWSWTGLFVAIITASGVTIAALIANRLSPSKLFDNKYSEQFHIRAGRYLSAVICFSVISAVFGISSYHFLYSPLEPGFFNSLIGWIVADIMGVVTVTPFLYLLYIRNHLGSLGSFESILMVLLCSIIAFFVTGPGYHLLSPAFLQPTLIIIPLLWSVLRKPPIVVAFLSLLTFLLAWLGTSQGYGYYVEFFGSGALTAMQVVLCFSLVSIQLFEALLMQRRYELQRQNQLLEEKIKERTLDLEKAKSEAELLARTDPMTGLNNRRAFFDLGIQVEKEAARYDWSFCVLMLDIDYFKKVNDKFGHDIGDQAINCLADNIHSTIRDSDIAGRIGGEEFAIIIPKATNSEGLMLAERLQNNISSISIETTQGPLTFTVSIGLAYRQSVSDTLHIVLKRSDEALYTAKSSGRNCIKCVSYPP